MAEPQTYAELQQAVIDWTVRDDLAAKVPTFIGLAERRFNRLLRVPDMETVTTLTASAETVSLPIDFFEMRALSTDATPKVDLLQMSVADIRRNYATAELGIPTYFAVQGGDLLLGPAPSDATDLVLNYYARIPSLSDGAPTNWLLLDHPDLYLAASLAEAFAYTRDVAAVQGWEARTQAKITELQRHGIRKSTSGAPLVRRASNVA